MARTFGRGAIQYGGQNRQPRSPDVSGSGTPAGPATPVYLIVVSWGNGDEVEKNLRDNPRDTASKKFARGRERPCANYRGVDGRFISFHFLL